MSDDEHFAKEEVLVRQEDTKDEGTSYDAFDMQRLGKIQVLKVWSPGIFAARILES